MTGTPEDLVKRVRAAYSRGEYAEGDVALDELLACLGRFRDALERIADPICDATFRDRLLRHGLSNDEIAQYVESVEQLGDIARAALNPEQKP